MKQLKLDKFLDFKSVANLKKSPDNKYVSYVEVKMRQKENDYLHSLYLDDGKSINKIIDLKQSSKYYWETSNSILYFDYKSKADKELKKSSHTIIYRYNIDSKKEELAYTFPIKVSSIEVVNEGYRNQWNPDGDAQEAAMDFGRNLAKI